MSYSASNAFSAKEALSLIDNDVKEIFDGLLELTKCDDPDKMTADVLFKLTKKQLSEHLLNSLDTLVMCSRDLKKAIVKVDEQKNEHIALQNRIIEQQQELLTSKTEHLNSVQATVKSELKSYSDIVRKCMPAERDNVITSAQVKRAVKSVVEEEDRSKNVIVFGVKEEDEEELETKISEIFQQVNEKPRVSEVNRIGKVAEGKARPVKVTLSSSDAVFSVLSKAGQLKRTEDYKRVYLSVDRTFEQRAARKQLVEQLKRKRETQPDQNHVIKNNQIVSTSRVEGSVTTTGA